MMLDITHDQALVLFEWLSRMEEQDAFPCEDEAEKMVFLALHGQLESSLSEQFKSDYLDILTAARKRVREDLRAGFGR